MDQIRLLRDATRKDILISLYVLSVMTLPSQQFPKNSIRVHLSIERSALNYARIIELLVAAVFLFLFFSAMSFVFLRPALQEGRANVQREWNEFLQEVRERNDMLPGLLETVKMFQPFFAKNAVKMLEAKAVIKRSRDPEVIMASVDQLDVDIKTLEALVHSNPDMRQHPGFLRQWDLFLKKHNKVGLTRTRYNSSVQTYNDLIEVFPQSIFTSMFGYVRAAAYPPPPSVAE
jgi:LemA protein